MKSLENLFNETIDLIYTIFKDSAFLLPPRQKRKFKLPSTIIYDSMMQAFANNISHKDNLVKNGEFIRNNLYLNKQLLYSKEENNIDIFDPRYNNKKYIELRMNYFHNFLQSYI